MPVEDMVDASLVGLDQGEMVTIPGLHNGDEWTRFEAAPRSMLSQFGTSVPAPATGIKREGRHNWREMCVPGIQHALACLMRCSR
jgi:hypothetical protein